MKKNIYKTLKNIYDIFLFTQTTSSFKKRYQNIDNKLLINNLTPQDIRAYKAKWSVFGVKVELDTLNICYNLSGIFDLNIVPENIFARIIEKKLNVGSEAKFLSIKNIYNKWYVNKGLFPLIYLHKMNNVFYNSEYNIVEKELLLNNIKKIEFPCILKASKDTSGGKDVFIINNINDLKFYIDQYESIVVQELIHQSNLINEIYNHGISSVRVCLLRNSEGFFEVLNSSIRFGVNGSLDNETAGGIVCNINDNSLLNKFAVGKYAEKFFCHPNSKFVFENYSIPNYEDLIGNSIKIANEILFYNLVSLDMCLDSENVWRCIEVNLNSQTIRFRQYAGHGFFGDSTNEVINKVLNK